MTELEYWLEQITKGRISRREFMGRAVALGAGAALATTMLSSAGIAATPKRGGLARFGLPQGATTDSFDPGTWPDMGTQVPLWGSGANSLTEVDAAGNVIGDLAESFEASGDATTWVFKLHKGLTFHNGKTVTADDVVASFRHHMGEDSKSAVKSVLASIADIKADGPETVVFTLTGGSADFPYLTSDYHIPILQAKDDGSVDWQAGIWTGAFILEKFEPGVRTKMKRNPNYHKEGRPYFDEVLLQRVPNVAISEVTGYAHYVLPMNVTMAPFDDVNVRLALKYGINREEVVEKIFLGHATPGNDNPIAPSIKYAIDPEPKHSYDPDKAKFHLKEAGLTSLQVDLSAADAAFGGAVDTAVLFREPADGYWDNVWLKKAWCASYWSGRPTIDWMFSTAYAGGAAWNETFWANPRFDELLPIARAETDEKKRGEIYGEMQQLVHDDGGQIVLVFNNLLGAYSTKLAHGEIAPNWEFDGLRIAERWWFA
jgi:peptide/nickel transport system substrate-binding protein